MKVFYVCHFKLGHTFALRDVTAALERTDSVKQLNKAMNSIGEACIDLKKQYDSCFNAWFSERFLKGDMNDSVCAPLFKVYQQCVKRAMKENRIDVHEVEKDLLGTEQERQVPSAKGKS